MPVEISEFLASFSTDLAKPSRFEVVISLPTTVAGQDTPSKILMLTCENANLPGRTFATMEQKNYGPVQKYPYLSTYTDMDLTFIVTGNMVAKYVFERWMQYINHSFDFNFEYKKNYATDITIRQYDNSNILTYALKLINAFPVSINQMDLDSSSDTYHKLNVTFAYDYWEQLTLLEGNMSDFNRQSEEWNQQFDNQLAENQERWEVINSRTGYRPAPAPTPTALPNNPARVSPVGPAGGTFSNQRLDNN